MQTEKSVKQYLLYQKLLPYLDITSQEESCHFKRAIARHIASLCYWSIAE